MSAVSKFIESDCGMLISLALLNRQSMDRETKMPWISDSRAPSPGGVSGKMVIIEIADFVMKSDKRSVVSGLYFCVQ